MRQDSKIINEINTDLINQNKEILEIDLNKIIFVEVYNRIEALQSCIIYLSITNKLAKLLISPSDSIDIISSNNEREYQDIIKDLKNYFMKINQNLVFGYFYFDSAAKKIIFSIKFYAVSPEDKPIGFSYLQRYISLYYLHIKNIIDICTKSNANIRYIINRGINLKIPRRTTRKIAAAGLSKDQIVLEKSIINQMNSCKTNFLNVRFSLKNIEFKSDTIIYYGPIVGEEFKDEIEDAPGDLINSNFELIDELAKHSIYYKNSCFPIDLYL